MSELIGAGDGQPFTSGRKRVMREWVSVRPTDEAACLAYVVEARGFVARASREKP